jgi:hypothetical protein
MANEGREPEPDWRCHSWVRVAADVPPAYPGGPPINKGDLLITTALTKDDQGIPLGFTRPRVTALMLSIALDAAEKATKLRSSLVFRAAPTPFGTGKGVVSPSVPSLFDFFEQSIIAVTFSYQAIEAFCNETIEERVKGTFPLQANSRKKTMRIYRIDELQGELSVERKLRSVLPNLLTRPSPEGEAIWNGFCGLKRVRDTFTHLRSADAYKSSIDEQSLFFELFQTKPMAYPKYAIDIIQHFNENTGIPLWLQRAKERLV